MRGVRRIRGLRSLGSFLGLSVLNVSLSSSGPALRGRLSSLGCCGRPGLKSKIFSILPEGDCSIIKQAVVLIKSTGWCCKIRISSSRSSLITFDEYAALIISNVASLILAFSFHRPSSSRNCPSGLRLLSLAAALPINETTCGRNACRSGLDKTWGHV